MNVATLSEEKLGIARRAWLPNAPVVIPNATGNRGTINNEHRVLEETPNQIGLLYATSVMESYAFLKGTGLIARVSVKRVRACVGSKSRGYRLPSGHV